MLFLYICFASDVDGQREAVLWEVAVQRFSHTKQTSFVTSE